MKLLIFLFSFFHFQIVIAQKKPSQEASQKQMKEAMKAIDEIGKENPEMAKMAKSMLGQMQNNQNAVSSKDAPLSKVSSPITTINLKTPIQVPSNANDQLLWYKGKKLNDSMLVTKDGAVILYKRNKDLLIVQPKASKDPFDKMTRELVRNEERKRDLINQVSNMKNAFFYYPAIINTLKEYTAIANDYQSILKNTIALPPTNKHQQIPGTGKGGYNIFNDFTELKINKEITEAYNEVISLRNSAPSLEFPVPPSREYEVCYDCDYDNQKTKYEQAKKNWDSLFLEYETKLNRKAINVLRMVEMQNNGSDDELIKIREDMSHTMQFAFKREEQKVEMLQEQYGHDFNKLPIVIEAILSFERQKQLTGAGDDKNSFAAMDKINDLFSGFDNYIQHEMDNRNYNVVFNIPFIVGIERQKQLMGASDNTKIDYFNQVQAFNRFKLTASIEFVLESYDQEGKLESRMTGKMTTKNDIFVSLGYYDCKYQLYLSNTKYGEGEEKEYRIPYVINGGQKTVKTKDGFVTYDYSGPKDIYEVFPLFKISFCNEKSPDSAFMELMTYNQELKNYSKEVANSYSIDLLGYLSMVFLNVKELPDKTPDMESIGANMLSTLTSGHVIDPTGNAKLDKMQNDYNLSRLIYNQQAQLAQIGINNKFLFLFDAKNNNETLINGTTNNARSIDDRLKITKALVKIKVVHAPDDYIPSAKRMPLKKN